MKKLLCTAIAVAALTQVPTALAQRDNISIVGSSTVYPFSTVVAERFGRTGTFKTPKVEATGHRRRHQAVLRRRRRAAPRHRQRLAPHEGFASSRTAARTA